MTEVEWLPAVGWDGVYEVSNRGLVRRLKASKGTLPGTVLKGIARPSGHLMVTLRDHPRVEVTFIHRLVLAAFIGPCPEGMEGCHWDGDPTNNFVENLRWDTRSSNRLDSVRHGTHYSVTRTHCPWGHVLAEPNLIPSSKARRCLACKRARSLAWIRGEKMTQELADKYYADIMTTNAALAA